MIASLLVMTYSSPIAQNLWITDPNKTVLLQNIAEFLQAHASNLKLPVTVAFAWFTLIGTLVTLSIAWLASLIVPGSPPPAGKKE